MVTPEHCFSLELGFKKICQPQNMVSALNWNSQKYGVHQFFFLYQLDNIGSTMSLNGTAIFKESALFTLQLQETLIPYSLCFHEDK